MAAEVFKTLDSAIKANQDKAKKINGVFQWVIDGKEYVIDLKGMNAGPGKAAKPDVTLTVAEKDFLDLMSGKAQGQALFMSGKIVCFLLLPSFPRHFRRFSTFLWTNAPPEVQGRTFSHGAWGTKRPRDTD